MRDKRALSKIIIKLILIAIVILFVAVMIYRAGLIDVFKNLPIFKQPTKLSKIEGVIIDGKKMDVILNEGGMCKPSPEGKYAEYSAFAINLNTRKLEWWNPDRKEWDKGEIDKELSKHIPNLELIEDMNWKWELRDALREKKDNLYLDFEGGLKMWLHSTWGLVAGTSKGQFTYGLGRFDDNPFYLWECNDLAGLCSAIRTQSMDDWRWSLHNSFMNSLILDENKLDFDGQSRTLILGADKPTTDKTNGKIILEIAIGGKGIYAIDSSGDLYWIGTGNNIVNLKTTDADKFLNLEFETKNSKKGWKDYLWEARLKKTLLDVCIEKR